MNHDLNIINQRKPPGNSVWPMYHNISDQLNTLQSLKIDIMRQIFELAPEKLSFELDNFS